MKRALLGLFVVAALGLATPSAFADRGHRSSWGFSVGVGSGYGWGGVSYGRGWGGGYYGGPRWYGGVSFYAPTYYYPSYYYAPPAYVAPAPVYVAPPVYYPSYYYAPGPRYYGGGVYYRY